MRIPQEIHKDSGFDIITKGAILLFLCILFGYGPDHRIVFIPVEIIFLLILGLRFLVKRYSFSLFAAWSFIFLVLGTITIFYTPEKTITLSRIKSLVQVLVFANLLVPYLLESKRNIGFFLLSMLLASAFLAIRILLSGPMSIVFQTRLGDSIGVSPNTVGYVFSIATVIGLYLMMEKRNWWISLLIAFFLVLALFSGSKKVVLFIGVGCFILLLSSQKTKKGVWSVIGVSLLVVVLSIILIFTWEPLYSVIGQRTIGMFQTLTGNGIEESTSIRLGMIHEAWALFLKKPIFGWGLGVFTKLSSYDMYSHNSYSELLVSVGIVGTFVYYSLYGFLLRKGFSLFKKRHSDSFFILSIGILIAMLFDGIGRVPYNEEISNILLALCYAGVMIDYPNKGLDVVGFLIKRLKRERKTEE